MSDEKEVVIEVEEFISLVRARRCLWDAADCKYSKRDYQRVAWMEVADATHAPGQTHTYSCLRSIGAAQRNSQTNV